MDVEIIKLAKSLKRDLIMITNNYIAGTDIYRCMLSMINEGSTETFAGSMAELNNRNNPDYYIGSERTAQEITGLIKRTFDAIEGRQPVFSVDNLKCDESFNDALSKKMSDGAYTYILNMRYPMYMFSSLHPVNKSDKIKCEIFDIGDNKTYMAHFIIYKPKYMIHEYIRYLYL